MRTKTLLIASAALAAGILTSSAQTYSQNIVGYVAKSLPLGYSVCSVPLNGDPTQGGNGLTNLIQNSGQLDGALLFTWTGTKYAGVSFDSTMPQGFADGTDSFSIPCPTVNPGQGFLINNNTGVALTNVFTGTVAISSLPGTTTNNLPAGEFFYSSVLPYGGGISSVLQLANNGNLDGTVLQFPNIVGGNLKGYTGVTFDSTMPGGFADGTDSFSVPEPIIPVGGGFLYNNNAGLGTFQWVQTLNP